MVGHTALAKDGRIQRCGRRHRWHKDRLQQCVRFQGCGLGLQGSRNGQISIMNLITLHMRAYSIQGVRIRVTPEH